MSTTIANMPSGRRFGPPGVYVLHSERTAQPSTELTRGVPAFLGYSKLSDGVIGYRNQPFVVLTRWDPSFLETSVAPADDSFLPQAIHGFFANGGKKCFVVASG